MKKNAQRILSGILAVLILSVAALPVYAVSTGSPLYDTVDFYSYVYGIYKGWREGHPDTDYSEYRGFRAGPFGSDPDKMGGGSFGGGAGRKDYDDYVSDLPAQGYNSGGGLRWSPDHDYISATWPANYGTCDWFCDSYSGTKKDTSDLSPLTIVESCSQNSINVAPPSGSANFSPIVIDFFFKGQAPVDGMYERISSPAFSGYWLTSSGTRTSISTDWEPSGFSTFYASGASIATHFSSLGYQGAYLSLVCAPPVYEVTPSASLSDTTYNTTTRPTSIIGGNYGIVGDNNQITKVEDNSSIVNETNNTYYNPATGVTAPITNWSYDYSDRSYKVNLEGGKTSSVTYGDENITIVETTVNESGDTITNNYTIYYLGDGSGSENPPSGCEHTWTETSSTAPTCTVPGSKLSTCSKCQQTKKEAVPALGHDWQIKQTVTTEYDETGQLTQQGYTIFECSRCHEQYKSTDGTIPPGGGSGTDPGEEDDTTIGGLIEKLLSGVGSIVGGIIKGLLSLLTKAVEALAGLAELFTTFVSSLVDLWGGFTSFLSAVFPFLPEEFIIIIELGLILVIAAAVFRKFIS